MYNLNSNNYHHEPKNSTIYTPPAVSQFLFNLLKDKLSDIHSLIFDPCVGKGSLLEPWKKAGYQTWGNDVDPDSPADSNRDFLTDFVIDWTAASALYPKLVLCNPPFNGYGKKLGSEVWLAKILELFGKNIPIVLFAPIGFRLNLTLASSRHIKFEQGIYPPISSQITLPKNILQMLSSIVRY